MPPRSREETERLFVEAIAALDRLDDKTRVELLESSGWMHLVVRPSPALNGRLDDYFEWCSEKREENAGELLEEIAYLLFQSLVGVGNLRSFQSYAPQHDLVVDGESNNWIVLLEYLHLPKSGRSIVVECKNQDEQVSDQQFSRLCGILQNKFQDTSHLGVFVSRTSATGFPKKPKRERSLRDARATQALFHAKTGKYVVVINHDDLIRMKQGANIAKILEAKIREVEASSGVALEFNNEWKEIVLPPHLAKHKV